MSALDWFTLAGCSIACTPLIVLGIEMVAQSEWANTFGRYMGWIK